MEVTIVLIIGIDSQNGIYLAKYLEEIGEPGEFKVIGTSRKSTEIAYAGVDELVPLDLCDLPNLIAILNKFLPDMIFVYAAKSSSLTVDTDFMSHVKLNFLPVSVILEWVHQTKSDTKVFYSSSAERFGNTSIVCNETSICNPTTFYGITKLLADQLVTFYRKEKNLFTVNAYFYNNESPLRNETYFSMKSISNAAKFRDGEIESVPVFNSKSVRDWSHTKDFVRAAWQVMNLQVADDYIFSSGKGHTVMEFVELCFAKMSLDPRGIVEFNSSHDAFPKDVADTATIRLGDNKKLLATGWSPEISLSDLCDDMIKMFSKNGESL